MLSFAFSRAPSLARVGSLTSFRRMCGGTGRAAVDFQLAFSNVDWERFLSMALGMASKPLQLARLLDGMPSTQCQVTRVTNDVVQRPYPHNEFISSPVRVPRQCSAAECQRLIAIDFRV